MHTGKKSENFPHRKLFTVYRIARMAITVTWLDDKICGEMWWQKKLPREVVVSSRHSLNVIPKNVDFLLRLALPKMCSEIVMRVCHF